MSQRTAIVTGGARGIGRGCAHHLARAGFNLVLVDLLEDDLAATATEIRQLGKKVSTHVADVSDHTLAQTIVTEVIEHFGEVNFLFNNAGRAMPKGLLEISEAEWDSTININLKSCFNWCRAVVPFMLENVQGGRIVNMSSINAPMMPLRPANTLPILFLCFLAVSNTPHAEAFITAVTPPD